MIQDHLGLQRAFSKVNTKNKLYKQHLQSPNDIRRQKFFTFRNKLHTIIRKSKRSFFFSKFQHAKGNIKETWKTINNVIGRGQRRALSKQFKNQSGKMITDSKYIADEFNNFFVKCWTKPCCKNQQY